MGLGAKTSQAQVVTTNTFTMTGVATTGGSDACGLVCVQWYGGAALAASTPVTDNKGNTWTQVQSSVQYGTDTNFRSALFKCERFTGGSGHTFTVTWAANVDVEVVNFIEWLGCITAGTIVDQAPAGNSDAHSTATPYVSTTTGTTAQADEVAIAFMSLYSTGATTYSYTWNNSYTNAGIDQTNPSIWTSSAGYKVLSATGTQQSSVTSNNTADDAISFIATLKLQSQAATVIVPRPEQRVEEVVDEPRIARRRFVVPSALAIDVPALGVWIGMEEPPAEERLPRRRAIVLPSGTVATTFIPERLSAARDEGCAPEDVPRRARAFPSSVDAPPLPYRRLAPEQFHPEPTQRRTLAFPSSVDAPVVLAREVVHDEQFPEEPVKRRRFAYAESVDSIPLEKHLAPLDQEFQVEQVQRLDFQPPAAPVVDQPPARQRRSNLEPDVEERVARRLLAPPSSVDAPSIRLRKTIGDDYFDGERVGRPARVQPPPPVAGDPPPRKALPRSYEEFVAETLPAKRFAPLPSGAAVLEWQPTIRRTREEPSPEEALPHRELPTQFLLGINSAGLAIWGPMEEPAPEDLPVRLLRRLPESVDALPPARRRSNHEGFAEERVVPRRLGQPMQAVAQVDSPIPSQRRWVRESFAEEALSRRASVPRPPATQVDQPPFARARRPVEILHAESLPKRGKILPPAPIPGDAPPLFLRRLPFEQLPEERPPRHYPGLPVGRHVDADGPLIGIWRAGSPIGVSGKWKDELGDFADQIFDETFDLTFE